MKTNLIVLNKEKLISIDAILPVVMELKAMSPKCSVIFIFPSVVNLDLVRKNRHLWEAIKRLGAKIYAPVRTGRLTNAAWLAMLFLRLMFARNIILKAGDTLFRHELFISCLRMFAKVVEIQFFILPPVYAFHAAMIRQWQIVYGNDNPKDYTPKHSFDYYMTSLPKQLMDDCYPGAAGSRPVIYTGYVRAMNQWTSFLKEMSENDKANGPEPYCLFILSTFGMRLDELEEPPLIELFKDSLVILNEFSDRIKTVFRPHPATDIEELRNILEDIGFQNYSIDFGHPMILSAGARFVIANFFSATMLDSFYLKVPTVEYCSYDRRLLEKIGNKSYGGECCNYFIDRNREQLRNVIADILVCKATFKTRNPDIMLENFPETPETPESFYQIFKKLLIPGS